MKLSQRLHIISSTEVGGAERMLEKILSENLVDKSSKTYLICLDVPGGLAKSFESLCEKVWYIPKKSMFGYQAFKTLKEAAVVAKPEVVVGWMYRGMLAATLMTMFFCKSRLVWTVRKTLHDSVREPFFTRCIIKVLAFLSNKPKSIIFNSQKAILAHSKKGFCVDKAVFIPNGFSEKQFYPSMEERKKIREELGLKNEVLIGVVARYHSVKGHEVVAQALVECWKKGLNAKLLFLGRGVLEFKNTGFYKSAIAGEFEDKIFFKEQVLETRPYINACDAIVSASYIEGFSNTIGEALFCKKVVFSTDAGDSAYILEAPDFVFSKGDSKKLESLILDLAKDPDEAVKKLDPSFKRAVDLFDIKSVAKKYEQVFMEKD